MCLYKRDDQEGTCNHESCKNYYMMNKQACELFLILMISNQYIMGIDQSRRNLPSAALADDYAILENLKKRLKTESEK